MFDNNKIKEIGKRTVLHEANAIFKIADYIDDSFAEAVTKISQSKGRVVITGIGKSAAIGTKIVASLNSTGTPSIFMHAADAIHGDLGIVQEDDIVICISKSGNTPEIKVLIPLIKRNNNLLIAIVSDTDSFLAKAADIVLRSTVDSEASPHNLAPSSSTTAQLVVGDALMVALLEMKGFTPNDFAKFHPGGSLGKKLYLKVNDIYVHNEKPSVSPDDDIKNVISEISSKRLGAAAVVDSNGNVIGIITDGDIRRMLNKFDSIKGIKASDIMSRNPKCIQNGELAINALELMHQNSIGQLLVIENNKYLGMVHLHDLMREGIV